MTDELWEYSERMSKPEPGVLSRLNRDTHLHIMHPRMLTGHITGAFLSMLSTMIRPHRILEIGTYTGYSCICLSKGLQEGGEIVTIEHDPELREMAEKYITEAGIINAVNLMTGEAATVLTELTGLFDLCFLDADKRDYLTLYPMIMKLMRPGGFVLADNVLWSGKILQEAASGDKDTRGLQEFNLMVKNDPAADNVLLPFDDGIMMIRKI